MRRNQVSSMCSDEAVRRTSHNCWLLGPIIIHLVMGLNFYLRGLPDRAAKIQSNYIGPP
jgi:hypothetical protein